MVIILADGVSFRQTNTGLVMLFNRVTGIMYELNETATEIAKLIADGPICEDEVVDRMCSSFVGNSGEVEQETRRFLNDFLKLGILTLATETHDGSRSTSQ